MRIAILHDYFDSIGGGEKVVLGLAQHLNADIFTYDFNEAKTYKEIKKFRVETAKNPVNRYGVKQFFATKHFENLNLQKNYDLFLMYGFISIHAAKLNHPNIWVAGAALKHLFLPEFVRLEPFYKRLIINLSNGWVKQKNIETIKNHIDKIIAVSDYQRKEIKKIYKRDSEVVYPPVETRKFYYKESEGYYLTVSRLEANKRVDLMINAFKSLPDQRLVIVGDGSQRKYLENLARGCKNIEFKGAIYGKELLELYARCTAFIFTSLFEDFGIVPLEAMAAGKPVISVNEGGPKETVIPNKTGLLIKPDVNSLIKSIEYLDIDRAKKMKSNCIKWARKFDEKIYFKKIEDVVSHTLNTSR